jgi:hypothetical protein
MNVQDIFLAGIKTELPYCFKKRKAFNITDGPPISTMTKSYSLAVLKMQSLISSVICGNHLDGTPQIVTAALDGFVKKSNICVTRNLSEFHVHLSRDAMHCVSTPFDIAQALILNFLQSRLIATFYEVVRVQKRDLMPTRLTMIFCTTFPYSRKVISPGYFMVSNCFQFEKANFPAGFSAMVAGEPLTISLTGR